jgi:hypothetical protein
MPEAEIAKAVQLLDVMLSGAPHPRGPKGHGLSSTILTVKMSGGILFQRSGQISIVARPLAFTPKSPETKRNGSRRFGPVSGYWRRSRSQQARRRLPVWPRAVPFNRVLPCRRAQYGSAPGSEFGNPRSQKQSESRKPPPGYGCSSSARDSENSRLMILLTAEPMVRKTLRWREVDSNHRSLSRRSRFWCLARISAHSGRGRQGHLRPTTLTSRLWPTKAAFCADRALLLVG